MGEALAIVKAWGFGAESNFDMGEATPSALAIFLELKRSTLFSGTRGKLDTRSDGISNVIFAPRSSRHSEKPEVFYDLVRKALLPPLWRSVPAATPA